MLDIGDFEELIGAVAQTYASDGVDHRGHDQEDYMNFLRFAAWDAIRKCPDEAGEGYVRVAIWNKAKDLYRAGRSAKRLAKDNETASLSLTGTVDPWAQVEASIDLQKLMSEAPVVFEELVSVLGADQTPDVLDLSLCRTSKYRRHRQNLRKARKVLSC